MPVPVTLYNVSYKSEDKGLPESNRKIKSRVRIDTERATEEELLEFANEVRKAGAAEPLDALIPSVRNQASACLIARALNFQSEVDHNVLENGNFEDGSPRWHMRTNKEAAQKIHEQTGLELDARGRVLLPKEIGNAADAFDQGLAFTHLESDDPHDEDYED